MLFTMRAWLLSCLVALVTLQAAVLSARLPARALPLDQQVIAREALPDLYEASIVELQVRRCQSLNSQQSYSRSMNPRQVYNPEYSQVSTSSR